MTELVSAVLARAAEAEASLASTAVIKPLDLELDLGNMLAIDPNQLDKTEEEVRSLAHLSFTLLHQMPTEEELLQLGRDGAQLLLNSLWQLETARVEEAVVAHLPPPSTVIPREKPVPKPKPLTKWEKYAKEKGKVAWISRILNIVL